MDWLVWHDRPITLHSGDESHWEVKGELMFADPHIKFSVLASWDKALQSFGVPRPFHFAGIPNGGLAWAEAMQQGRYRPEDTASIEEAKTVIIVDDVVTTGKSIEDFRKTLPPHVSILDLPILVVVRRGAIPVMTSWADMGGLGGQ